MNFKSLKIWIALAIEMWKNWCIYGCFKFKIVVVIQYRLYYEMIHSSQAPIPGNP